MKRFHFYLITFLISVLLSFFLTTAENSTSFLQLINLKGRDFYFQLRHTFSPAPVESNQILLVSIDDETIKRLENRWPYPRSIYVEAINRLKPFTPKAIGFDLIFSGQDSILENDVLFSTALNESGNVVIASHQSSAGEIGPEAKIRDQAWQIGIVDKPRDLDHVIRRSVFFFSIGGAILPSWELAIYEKVFGKLTVHSYDPKFVIDYRLKSEEFPNVSFWRLLEGSVLADELRNKIILIGPTAEVFHDLHSTPLGFMPGLAINANAILTLIRGKFFSFPPSWFMPMMNFFAIWLVLLLGSGKSFKHGIFITFSLVVLYVVIGFLFFISYLIIDFWLLILFLFIVLFFANLFRYGKKLFLNYQLKQSSRPDPLTGFYTEKFLRLKLQIELGQIVANQNKALILMMIEIDQLSKSSEHDRLLRVASQILKLSVRKNEFVCRYENDLFAIILPNTYLQDAVRFAEKIQKIVQDQKLIEPTEKIIFNIAMISSAQNGISDERSLLEAGKRMLKKGSSQTGNRISF